VVEGQAKGLQTRSESIGEGYSQTVWSFRIERYDDTGNRVQLVPVEMRAPSFEGNLSDGDWVRAHGRMRRGTFRATDVENLTTGANVRAKQVPKLLKVFMAVVIAGILLFIGWIAYSIITADKGFPDPPDFSTGAVVVDVHVAHVAGVHGITDLDGPGVVGATP
jgi:hypothetical protein